MNSEPRWLTRLRRVEVFDESRETCAGPRWAWLLALGSAAAAYACLAGAIFSLASEGAAVLHWALMYLSAFAISSGAAWHLGMRARSANQLIICVLGLAVIWLWRMT